MTPDLSKTINRVFPYLIMDRGGATLITKKRGDSVIDALATSMEITSEELDERLKNGETIHFNWAEETKGTPHSERSVSK